MYSARITRLNPTAFIILIDQSGSMEERVLFNATRMTKADSVALVTNRLISELILRSCREDGVRDYFDIAVIGYCGDRATSLLGEKGQFVRPSQLVQMDCPKRKITRERILPGGESVITTLEQKYWISPQAGGSTPMYAALLSAYDLAGRWCRRAHNRHSYPLTIFNITDGEASDGDPEQLQEIAEKIRALRTDDGNVLLLNIHISSHEGTSPVIFPASPEELPQDRYARLLYDMSSTMPAAYNETIFQIRDNPTDQPFRGMSYNTSITDLIAMMNIGSLSVNLIQ